MTDFISPETALLGAGALLAMGAVPFLYKGGGGGSSHSTSNRKEEGEVEEGVVSSLLGTASSWSRAMGMNQCGEMAICDAHANFRSYGLVALPVILMFPG